jgi:hypothetical protein
MRRLVVLILVLGLGGCFHPDLGQQPFQCGAGGECPPGYHCAAQICNADDGGGPDGGAVVDARPIADARPADAQPDAATTCRAGEIVCAADTARKCKSDGSGFDDTACDGLCFPALGCLTACSGGPASSTGCEFWPTPAANAASSAGFAVSIVNASDKLARVRIDGPLSAPQYLTIAAGQEAVATLPWIPELTSCPTETCVDFAGASGRVPQAAYRLLSTQPVAVTQWSPRGPAVSGDASRLLPKRTLGTDYVTVGLTPTGTWPSFFAVTGMLATTSVTVTPHATTLGSPAFPAIAAGQSKTFVIGPYSVLLLYSTGDLTGSQIVADKQVQVISGNSCASYAAAAAACSHIEEAILPRDALFYQALVIALPKVLTGARIVAADGPTTITISDGTTVTEQALPAQGAYVDVAIGDLALPSVLVSSKEQKALLVAQTIVAAPAMTIYRPLVDTATFIDVPAWTGHTVIIAARTGQPVLLDGMPLMVPAVPIGASGFARLLSDVAPGPHVIQSTDLAGVSVIGSDTSVATATFWY